MRKGEPEFAMDALERGDTRALKKAKIVSSQEMSPHRRLGVRLGAKRAFFRKVRRKDLLHTDLLDQLPVLLGIVTQGEVKMDTPTATPEILGTELHPRHAQ